MAVADYHLNARQRATYTHLADLYRVVRTANTDGRGTPGDDAVELAYSGVPCHVELTPNFDAATDIGRMKTEMIFTTDVYHFSADQEIGNGWWIVNKSLNADGSKSAIYGMVHKVLGGPNIIPGSARRPVNKLSVMASSEETPPAGLDVD